MMERRSDEGVATAGGRLRGRFGRAVLAGSATMGIVGVAWSVPPLSHIVKAGVSIDGLEPTTGVAATRDDGSQRSGLSLTAGESADARSAGVGSSDVAASDNLPIAPPPVDPDAPVRTFPLEDILPKREIGAADFLGEYPTYDGRGTMIAIFDTGVDPGAPGLQVTTDGKPKIVDVIDGTGSGDIDTSTVVTLSEDGTIEGLSGRTLRPSPEWSNPTGEYRVGMKPAYELLPRGLVNRLSSDRTEELQERHRALLVELRKRLAAWDAEHPSPTRAQLEEREELAARLEQAEAIGSMEDPGPVFDAVVFHDGETWRAALDTDEDGDLSDETLLTNFRDERRFGTFDDEQLMNYVLNIYNDGDLLSVVMDVGAHGTHVAGIAAAHFPDEPAKNGIAPGAQIVSVKIGDTRSGGGSTGTGMERGFIACMELGVDVINMSYGGQTAFPRDGRFEALMQEVVHDHNIVFLASAGNSGPALSTVSSPGGTSEWTIGVGATVTPAMMEAMHNVRRPYDALQYTWSSRGPTTNGALGVDITAPGGAIAPVPNWYHRNSMMMNGTSMSSPNAAGGVSLLISGLKQNGLGYSTKCIRRALVNTAERIPGEEPWGEGAGMMRVDRAWDHLYETNGRADRDVYYRLSLSDGGRGVYLREPHETDVAMETSVRVSPVFPENYEPRKKVAFEVPVRLEATADWVETPGYALISTGGDAFTIKVDPRGLETGPHFAEVRGFDDSDPGAGPLFSVPVTMIKPKELGESEGFVHREMMTFSPGRIERRFVEAPAGATFANIAIRRLDENTASTVVVHAVQLHDDTAFGMTNVERWVRFDRGDEEVVSVAVVGGGTLEVSLAQFWASLVEDGRFEVEVSFEGVLPDTGFGTIALAPTNKVTTTWVTATLDDATIDPSASFTHAVRTVGAESAVIRPLGDAGRDEWPEGRRLHELVTTYSVELAEDGSYSFYDTSFPPVREYASGLTEIFDENNKPLGLGGWWRERSMKAGTYTVRTHYRHDDVAELERIKGTPLHVRERLSRLVSVRVHDHPDRAWKGQGSHGERDLRRGERRAVHFDHPDREDLPEHLEVGDVLMGSVTFGKDRSEFAGAGSRPGGFPLMMVVGPAAADLDDAPSATDEDDEDAVELTAEQELMREIVAAKLERLSVLDDSEEERALFDRLVEDVRSTVVEHEPDEAERRRVELALLKARLDRAAEHHAEDDPGAVVAAAEAVIDAIDGDAIAAHLALDHADDDREAARLTDRYTAERTMLIGALHRRAEALHTIATAEDDAERGAVAEIGDAEAGADGSADDGVGDTADDPAALAADRFEAAWRDLDRWADVTDEEYRELRLGREMLRGRYGAALAIVNDAMADEPMDADLAEHRLKLLDRLGWTHLVSKEKNRHLVERRDGLPPI